MFGLKKNIKLLLFFCCSQMVQADETITFNISPVGYPPYMINNASGKSSGIIVEVLEQIANKNGYQIKNIGIPKNRIIKSMLSGSLDAAPTAIEWESNLERYAFTDVIVVVNDVLFSLKSAPLNYNKPTDLLGKMIGIHLGYNYPQFKPYFDDGTIKKTEATSELLMLRKTLMKRSDATIVTDLVGKWIIKNNPILQGKFEISKKPVNSFDYRIMFNKKWQSFVDIFNRELALMQANGEIKEILAKYE